MKVYTVTQSDLNTRSIPSLETTVYHNLARAQIDFLDGTPFNAWAELTDFSKRLNRWEPGDTWGQHLTDEDREKVPCLLEGSPVMVNVSRDFALWIDGAYDGISLSLEAHEI